MLFTFTDGENDSDLLQFCPKQKAYVKLLEDRIRTLEFQMKKQVRETMEILEGRKK